MLGPVLASNLAYLYIRAFFPEEGGKFLKSAFGKAVWLQKDAEFPFQHQNAGMFQTAGFYDLVIAEGAMVSGI